MDIFLIINMILKIANSLILIIPLYFLLNFIMNQFIKLLNLNETITSNLISATISIITITMILNFPDVY